MSDPFIEDIIDPKTVEYKALSDLARLWDSYIEDCFKQCGFTRDYILEHPDEFKTQGTLDIRNKAIITYLWKDAPIFTIVPSTEFKAVNSSYLFFSYGCRAYAFFYTKRKDDAHG